MLTSSPADLTAEQTASALENLTWLLPSMRKDTVAALPPSDRLTYVAREVAAWRMEQKATGRGYVGARGDLRRVKARVIPAQPHFECHRHVNSIYHRFSLLEEEVIAPKQNKRETEDSLTAERLFAEFLEQTLISR